MKRGIAVLITTVSLACLTLAYPIETLAKDKLAKTPPKPGFTCVEIDIGATRLPTSYMGNSIVDIVFSLEKEKEKLQKGEFEKEVDYRDRLASFRFQKLPNGVLCSNFKHDSLVAFVVSERTDAVYSAEAGEMKITLSENFAIQDSRIALMLSVAKPEEVKNSLLLRTDVIGFEVAKTFRKKREYIGQNAYGARTKVNVVEAETFQIVIPGTSRLRTKYTGLVGSVKMEPLVAQRAKQNGRVLLIGQLRPPYIGRGEAGGSATVSNPTEVHLRYRYVAVDPVYVWYFDGKTGEIYAKFDARPVGDESEIMGTK